MASFADPYLIQWTRGFRADLERVNPMLLEGQPGLERDTGKFKIGDGDHRWNDLDYFISESRITALVHALLGDSGSVSGSDWQQALQDHIDSETPHPVYDDGPSFELLYQNAKV